jgi:hypothetical protein
LWFFASLLAKASFARITQKSPAFAEAFCFRRDDWIGFAALSHPGGGPNRKVLASLRSSAPFSIRANASKLATLS